jgi:hypothetical protein
LRGFAPGDQRIGHVASLSISSDILQWPVIWPWADVLQ